MMDFQELMKGAVDFFSTFDKSKPVRVVSHLDSDGICSASIIIKLLLEKNYKYSVSIVQQLSNEVLQEIIREDYEQFILADLGSGQLNSIKDLLKDKKVLILDHHQPQGSADDHVYHANPHLVGIDGDKGVSGSGMAYYFAINVDKKFEDMSHIAVVGAIGDVQEDQGFTGLNKQILDTAVEKNLIQVKRGLRFFGANSRPIHKALEYSTDPYVPGVSGSESAAVQFLMNMDIELKSNNKWRTLNDLSENETKKLVAGIVMKRVNEDNPYDILGNIYTLPYEKEDSPTRDAREFSTLLNACGRLGKSSLGIGACLGNKKILIRAIQALGDYKRELIKAIKWYEKHENTPFVMKGKGYMIINAEDNILSTIIGTLASIITKTGGVEDNTLVMSLAQLIDNTTKVSLRIASTKPRQDINLKDIVREIVDKVGGEAGGHQYAAGAVIPTSKEAEFIQVAREVLEKKALEEAVI